MKKLFVAIGIVVLTIFSNFSSPHAQELWMEGSYSTPLRDDSDKAEMFINLRTALERKGFTYVSGYIDELEFYKYGEGVDIEFVITIEDYGSDLELVTYIDFYAEFPERNLKCLKQLIDIIKKVTKKY